MSRTSIRGFSELEGSWKTICIFCRSLRRVERPRRVMSMLFRRARAAALSPSASEASRRSTSSTLSPGWSK